MLGLMRLWDILLLGLKSLLMHKVRSALTALGIIFGVCSVIAMLAINEGASFQSQQALRELGSDNIILSSIKPPEQAKASGSDRGWSAMVYGLTHEDVVRLREVPGVRRCVTVHRLSAEATVGQKTAPVAVLATEPAYLEASRARLRGPADRFLSHVDIVRNAAVCVITDQLARKLFDYEDPLLKTIRLQKEQFTVVGVLDRLPEKMAGPAPEGNNYVLIPQSTSKMRFGEYDAERKSGSFSIQKVEVNRAILQMENEQAVVDGAAVIESLLERFHDEKDYRVDVPYLLLEQKKAQARLWNVMFLAIALVSLVVGGIGIMNIMLASVTERTREIGIRRALGAKRRDITLQFLTESLALATVGGLLGIGIGLVVPWAVEEYLNFKTIVSPTTLFLPFITALIVGLISGLYPALRAARLDPIIALRHE